MEDSVDVHLDVDDDEHDEVDHDHTLTEALDAEAKVAMRRGDSG